MPALQRKHWILLGVVAYLLFMLVHLPARVLAGTLTRNGVITGELTGTVWDGQAQQLQAGVLHLGKVAWQWRVLPLFTGKLAADIQVTQDNGHAEARVAWSLGGTLTVTQLNASMPLQSLVGSGGLPGGWVGKAQARFNDLSFKNNWPVAAHGELDVLDLTGPARAPNNLGSYHLSFPANNNQQNSNEQALVGALTDHPDAALGVTGTLKLAANRSYLLDTLVMARGNAPADIVQGMQMLGAPDAQGRRPFSVSGTF